MALWDSADLLARCLRDTGADRVPDEGQSSADWYAFLTEAQDQFVRMLIGLFPQALATAPVQLATADSGFTYVFPTAPLTLVELTDGKGGTPLRLGEYYDGSSDFVWEGELTLRMARDTARSFGAGLWARYIAQPSTIDETTEPSLPNQYRPPLVPLACYRWAKRGGYKDAQPYLDYFNRLWSGDPSISGDTGMLGALRRKQAHQIGMTGPIPWYRATGDIFG